ncbi:MAG: tRNA 2-selenouridine(34) synthase MnmH [Luminiphilus sp.]|jgi:tRNA 2-selenouridine synthase
MLAIDDFRALFLGNTPLIDVRAPVEFAKGSLPFAVNLPLLNDSERAAVGTCYRHSGQAAAVSLGHELISGSVRDERVGRWIQFANKHPEGALFCFRGGMRSEISQQWLAEAGINYPRIKGGYKALRQWLMNQTDTLLASSALLLVGGQTGVAKTQLLNQGHGGCPIPGSIDLEGLANHRGSAFGRRITDQPTQIGFELALGMALVQHNADNHPFLILEDEGRLIGRCALPDSLQAARIEADWVRVEASLSERVDHSYDCYILGNFQEYLDSGEEQAFEIFAEGLLAALERIRKRLGGKRHDAMRDVMHAALLSHRRGDPEQHKLWIEVLLAEYYDPMYEHQMRQRIKPPIFRGNQTEVAEFLVSQRPPDSFTDVAGNS